MLCSKTVFDLSEYETYNIRYNCNYYKPTNDNIGSIDKPERFWRESENIGLSNTVVYDNRKRQ